MESISQIFINNIVLVFFFYGLAFFSMGLAILLESRRSSEFPLAAAMVPLAGFGIIHGLQEWFEMFELLELSGATNIPAWLLSPTVRIAHLVISFALLTAFGVQLIYTNHRHDGRERLFAYTAAGLLIGVWGVSLIVSRWLYQPTPQEAIIMADVLARYVLAVPGALLAAWAIYLEQRTFKARGMAQFGRALLYAAVALLLYGTLGQLFPAPSVLFPSNVINSQLFLDVTGFPIQLFRTTMAIVMALAIIRALRVFEIESRQRLQEANEAREQAQQEALAAEERARQQTEQLNRELQEALQILSSLYTFSREVATTLDRDVLLKETLPHFIRQEPRISASMVLLRERPGRPLREMVRTECQADPETKAIMEHNARIVGEFVAEHGKSAYWDGLSVRPLTSPELLATHNGSADQMATMTARRTLGVPLLIGDQVMGSMVVCTGSLLPPFGPQDYSFISTIAGQLSVALQKASSYREVHERDVLRGELLHRVVSAQEQERQRIARELHDGTGQILTALGLGLAAAQGSIARDLDTAVHQIAELRTLTNTALEELHNIISDLRPSVLDDLGLLPALRGQTQVFETRSGVEAQLHVSGDRRRLDPDLELIIFRIAQEALTNVAKHAAATRVDIYLAYGSDDVTLAIRDNGRGFNPHQALTRTGHNRRHAWGLLGMQERVALVGGSVDIISQSEEGTTVQVKIPLHFEGEDIEEVYVEN